MDSSEHNARTLEKAYGAAVGKLPASARFVIEQHITNEAQQAIGAIYRNGEKANIAVIKAEYEKYLTALDDTDAAAIGQFVAIKAKRIAAAAPTNY